MPNEIFYIYYLVIVDVAMNMCAKATFTFGISSSTTRHYDIRVSNLKDYSIDKLLWNIKISYSLFEKIILLTERQAGRQTNL